MCLNSTQRNGETSASRLIARRGMLEKSPSLVSPKTKRYERWGQSARKKFSKAVLLTALADWLWDSRNRNQRVIAIVLLLVYCFLELRFS